MTRQLAPRRPGWSSAARSCFTKIVSSNSIKSREAQGLPAYINPRNTASGSLKQKDSRETAKRKLSAYIYDIVDSEGVAVC